MAGTTSAPTRRRRLLSICVGPLALVVAATGCTSGAPATESAGTSGGATSGASVPSPSTTTTPPATVGVTPADGAKGVLPDAPVTVSATGGSVEDVTVTDAKGRTIKGSLKDGTWTSTGRLRPSSSYTVEVAAKNDAGTTTTSTSSFTTLTPKVTATYGVFYGGQTVGVGMPATIQFDSAVTTKKYRAAVEKAVKITTVPAQAGSWGWLDDRQLMWRPKDYWKPGTKVTVSAPLTGYQTGDHKWIDKDHSASFSIGDSRISYVDMDSHVMRVTKNGQTVRTIPVSTGKDLPQYVTRYGTKVIIDKQAAMTMDAASLGVAKDDPNYYKLDTKWNMRVTWTGEFLHSAPWSVGSQGSANVSHGCTNLAPANAEWMYNFSDIGDVVKFTGSNRPFLPTEGIGVWEYSWDQWRKQSALSEDSTAG